MGVTGRAGLRYRDASAWEPFMRAAVIASVFVLACSGDTEPLDTQDSGPTTPSEEEAACRLRGEAGRRLTAGPTPDATAPAMALAAEPNTISIVPDRANYVRVEAEAPGMLVLFAGVPDVFVQMVDGTNPLPSEEPAPVSGCAEDVPERHEIDLPEAGTYHARIAWAGFSELWVYAELL